MTKIQKYAVLSEKDCVACGCCENVCPRDAIQVYKGSYAKIREPLCIGCGLCQKACPASIIRLEVRK